MKFPWDKKYLHAGVTVFVTAAAILLFYYVIFHMSNLLTHLGNIYRVLKPLLYGAAIAYVLNPIVRFTENKVFFRLLQKMKIEITLRKRKVIRTICVVFAIFLMFLVIYALLAMMVPELIKSILNISEQIPLYIRNVQNFLSNIFKNNPNMEESSNDILVDLSSRLMTWLNTSFQPEANRFLTIFQNQLLDIAVFLKNFLIGAMISIYMLYGKEKFIAHGKRLLYAVCSNTELANDLIDDCRFIDHTFGGFIIGKLIDSAIIGVLCYIGMSILKMPFTLLVSVFVGITNVIPFFGPYFGAIPSAFLIFLVNPLQSLYFIIFVFLLQQLDGNFIGPKILGNTTGLSSFMVIVAILVGGGFFGVFGMFVGVPVCAVICTAIGSALKRRLEKQHYPSDLEQYKSINHLDPETRMPVMKIESDAIEPFAFHDYRKKQMGTTEHDQDEEETK